MKSGHPRFVSNRTLLSVFSGLLWLVLLFSFGCQSNNADSSLVPPTSVPPTSASPVSPSVITTDDRDSDGIADLIEDQLIQRFAPVVRFHADEQYQPANIPWYLSRVQMRFDVSHGFERSCQ